MKVRSVLLAVVLLAATTAGTGATTMTVSDPAHGLMASINEARIARGLVPLRADPRLWAIASERAGRLAASGILSHEAAGSLPGDLAAHVVRWYGYGEDIGYATASPSVAIGAILRMWASSAEHWPLLMSASYNYLGVGLAYASGSGRTFASVVMTESPDRSGARAAFVGAIVTGNDIRWSWRGWDLPLQSRTAGLRDFEIQLRMDRLTWVTIGHAITATSRTTSDRRLGHWYSFRARARDQVGNVGPWSRERRVWLP